MMHFLDAPCGLKTKGVLQTVGQKRAFESKEGIPGQFGRVVGRVVALLLQPTPNPVPQPLDRAKGRLVGHLSALPDPIAEVKVAQAEFAATLDLPQDVIGPIAGAGWRRVVERVDR